MRALAFLLPLVLLLSCSSPASAEPATCAPECAPKTRMRSVPLFVTGVVFDVLGGVATIGGVGLIAAGGSCDEVRGCPGLLVTLAGAGAMMGGAALLAIGIPLTVVGGRSVPVTKASGPSLRLAVDGAALGWRF